MLVSTVLVLSRLSYKMGQKSLLHPEPWMIQKNPFVIEKEALAYFWAVKHFRIYLWGRRFIFKIWSQTSFSFTHHVSFWMSNTKNSQICHQTNGLWFPDSVSSRHWEHCCRFLSHLPIPYHEVAIEKDDWIVEEVCAKARNEHSLRVDTDMREDKILQNLKTYIINGWPYKKTLATV